MFEDSTIRRYTRQAASLARSEDLDAEGLAQVAEIARAYRAAVAAAVATMRDRGYSWSEIGRGLGMSRQQAFRDYQRHTGA